MEARILDTEVGEIGTLFADWPHPSYKEELNTMEWPERFGHVRAQEVIDVIKAEADRARFKVIRVIPRVAALVRFNAFGCDRDGRVIGHKIGRLHVKVQVAWQNKRGGAHLRWYMTINLHAAGTSPDVFSEAVSARRGRRAA